MLAHGFTVPQMATLIRAGLATATAERMVSRPPSMRGVLIRSIVILGALVIGPLAQAEPVHLTCEGEMHLINANGAQRKNTNTPCLSQSISALEPSQSALTKG
jgi:hypothetical protein